MAKASAAVNLLDFDQEAIKAREKEVAKESDESIITRIKERFEILEDMTKGV